MAVFKRFAATIGGAALLLVGAAMMVLPGPGILLIVAGLAVLATEYVWARRLLVKARDQAQKVQEAAVASPLRTAGSIVFGLALVGVGVAMFLVDDVAWPFLESLLDSLWSRLTGGVLVVTGLIPVTTTWITMRTAKGEETTHTVDQVPGAQSRGASRYDAP